ncbi:uncharacterized protein LOC128225240 [Mya arenaria]|uniref:uncharacterized protein LOC128225240 n=1 Tax=Mya arenaria TaxID=6604 RepID=UPI0022E75CD5|nr:uncharacterized protein LOC128225240 [Mya arenaria]
MAESVRILWLVSLSFLGAARGMEHVEWFGRTDSQEVIDTHNELRRSIYNAANMRELTWNEGVATAAAEWGSRCEYVSRPDNQWGQNMNYFHSNDYHKPAIDLFRSSFHSWTNETMHYDYRRYRYCGSKNVCSYVQLIAADVQEVGCAVVRCPVLSLRAPNTSQTHTKLLVCFYTPWVNILGQEVFIPDKRCAACPEGTTCVDNLCSARFYQTGNTKILPTQNSPGVKIESISGTRDQSSQTSKDRNGNKEDRVRPQDRSRDRESRRRERKERRRQRQRGGDKTSTDRIIGSHNTFAVATSSAGSENRVHQELQHGGKNETFVVYTPNNRVVPFPGRDDRRNIRKIERYEAKAEGDLDRKQEKIVHTLELIATNITSVELAAHNDTLKSRRKRQVSIHDPRYMEWYDNVLRTRRREYERYLRDYENVIRERQERRWRYEQELRRREQHNNHVAELRRADHQTQYNGELRRRQERLQRERQRYEALALTANQGQLTGEEQFFIISAHNLLRKEAGVRDLAWSSHLERWAKYVIRCETEYPGPITCYTNFGKADQGEEIYNVVYEWGTEGGDLRKPLQYGCRTPADKSLCNHNTNMLQPSMDQMACASKACGSQRQLTCIYSSG